MPEELPILTRAREAVWDAIENSPLLVDPDNPTQRAFTSVFRFDRKNPQLPGTAPTGPGQLPCLAIQPATVDPSWWTNEMMHFALVLKCTIWTPGEFLPTAENLVERLWKAIYRTRPGNAETGATYIQRGGSKMPERLGPVTFEFVQLGDKGAEATKVTLNIGLRLHQDPFAD